MPAEGSPSSEREFLELLPLIERVIAFVARRHHLSSSEVDDFASHVKVKLISDDYAVLRKFERRSKLRTYLTIVISRICLDYRIAAWGRWRPSAEARRGGETAMLLERLLMREEYTFEQACEMVTTNYGLAISRAEMERLVAALPIRSKRRTEPAEVLTGLAAPDLPADKLMAEARRQEMAERINAALAAVKSRLDPHERLLLVLRFEDGLTVAETARVVGADQKALYRRLNALYRKLREALEDEGIKASDALGVLADES